MRCLKIIFLSLLAVTPLFDLKAEEHLVTFEELLVESIERSPESAALKANILRGRADAAEAGTVENPELTLEDRPPVSSSGSSDTEYEISLMQPLTFSDFGKRQRLAELLNEKASLEEKAVLLELSAGLRLSYGKAWATQERGSRLERALRSTEVISRKMRNLAAKGGVPRSGMIFLNMEVERIKADLMGARADLKRAFSELTRKTGLALNGKRLTKISRSPIDLKSLEEADEEIPVVRRAEIAARVAKEQAELARLDSYTKFAPRLGFEHTDDGYDRITVGIQYTVPLFDREEARRLRAQADASERSTAASYFEGEAFQAELSFLAEAANSAAEEAARYEKTILPGLESAIGASEHEFRSGEGDPIRIWQALNALTEAEERYFGLCVKALSLRTELSLLLGREI